jgi:hypothetical protein
MDVSVSAWLSTREESLVIKRESFAFLFDRRYTNRLNRMSRIFFEAYAKATKELAAQEDRFPSLSEIDAMMESGAVYAFKDRIMKNTEFFEEIKISGVSYLVPRASRFIDESGTYTELFLDFEQGTVILPARKKTPVPSASGQPEESIPREFGTEQLEGKDLEISKEEIDSTTYLSSDSAAAYAQNDQQLNYVGHAPEPFAGYDEEPAPLAAGPEKEPSAATLEPSKESVTYEDTLPEPKPRKPLIGSKDNRKLVAAGLIFIFIIIALGAMIIPSLRHTGTVYPINYYAYLSDDNDSAYLGLDIYNSKGIVNDIQMALPIDIDKSINARGGVVTISHAANTIVQLNSSNDASIKVYLNGNWSSVPVNFSIKVPDGYESSIQVHGKDYDVKRKEDSLVIGSNLTQEGVRFEQSLIAR